MLKRACVIGGMSATGIVWIVTLGNLLLPTQRELVMLAGLRAVLLLAATAAFLSLLHASPRWSIAALVLMLYHGGGIASYSIPEAHTLSANPRLKILYANVDRPSHSWDALRIIVEEFDPDIFIADEVDEIWQPQMAWADSTYPHRVASWDGYGMAIYSRLPIEDSTVITEPGRFGKTIPVKCEWQGTRFRIYATHINSPVDDAGFLKQARQFDTVARTVKGFPEETFIAGDMNACETRLEFRTLLSDCRLRDSRSGFGWQASWPFGWPVLSIPLDHILVPEGWQVVDRRLGPFYGSDHRPVLLTVTRDGDMESGTQDGI